MKVLKKGRAQKGWAKEFVCTCKGNGGGGCGAKLLVEKGDVRHETLYYFDECETNVYFRCPECGVRTEIKNYFG
ncbi:MAG: hypothetical protein WC551_00130 [Patescibacteria group bacterium]